MRKYIVYDTTGNPVGVPFNTLREAEAYKTIYGRYNWTIESVRIKIDKKSTEKQRKAVSFIEYWCDISFEGDINNFYEVSDFLSNYLDVAKEIAADATASYWSMINDKD